MDNKVYKPLISGIPGGYVTDISLIEGLQELVDSKASFYGECDISPSTVAKTVTTLNGGFVLKEGARVSIKFLQGHSASTMTLNVDDTGAKNVYRDGNSPKPDMIKAHNVYEFVYDGTYWRIIGIDTNTTYSIATISSQGLMSSADKTKLDTYPAEYSDAVSQILSYVDTSISNLVDSAPETLNTLNELATAITENQSVIETLDSAITNKQDLLVDNINIKTINNNSILGSGNIDIKEFDPVTIEIENPYINDIQFSDELYNKIINSSTLYIKITSSNEIILLDHKKIYDNYIVFQGYTTDGYYTNVYYLNIYENKRITLYYDHTSIYDIIDDNVKNVRFVNILLEEELRDGLEIEQLYLSPENLNIIRIVINSEDFFTEEFSLYLYNIDFNYETRYFTLNFKGEYKNNIVDAYVSTEDGVLHINLKPLKQDVLVSGESIKTINGESILGEGNINIENNSEQVQSDWNETDNTSPAYIANKPNIYVDEYHSIIVDNAAMPNEIGLLSTSAIGQIGIKIGMNNITWHGFDGDRSTSHTITSSGDGTKFLSNDGNYKTIKTINGESLLNSGNISVQEVIPDLDTIRSNAELGAVALELSKTYTDEAINSFDTKVITLKIHLKEGWNWFSSYVNIDGTTGFEKVTNALETSGIQIVDESNSYTNYNAGANRWFGTLKSTSTDQMYMINVNKDCDIYLKGKQVNPKNIPITLTANVMTWIPYLVDIELPIAEALVNLTPTEGDTIKNEDDVIITYTNSLWSTEFTTFVPGKGYMYTSNNSSDVIFTYPDIYYKPFGNVEVSSELGESTIKAASLDLVTKVSEESKQYVDDKIDNLNKVTQTIDLLSGWNWVSFYVNTTLEELYSILGTNGISIETTSTGGVGDADLVNTYDSSTNSWSGNITELDFSKMYAINVSEATTIEVSGEPLNVEDYTISLEPGWTWIGYPLNQVTELDVLPFTPAEGDVIKSKNSSFMYWGGEWFPNNNLTPGKGYQYKSNDNTTKTFTYPTKEEILDIKLSKKQDKLVSGTNIKTINGTSILGSGNISTAYLQVNHGTSDTTFALTPNVLHVWDEVTELSLTLADPTDTTVANEYLFQFTSGATATTLTLPDTIKWLETPSIESDKVYQVSILNNCGTILGFV